MAVKQLPKLSEIPEPPDRLVGDQERFDTMTFDSLKAQKKMVNEDLNKTFIPKLNEFAVDVNASVTAAAQSERNAAASAERAEGEANEAAASAATAGTKAGEAAQSAAGAKTSETNAAASKSAAAKSATDAATAQRGAEAARDEARNLANVGYASEAKAGLAKVDGKTTQADAGGMITVKDVAIGGDAADLASARGQIGTPPIRSFTKTSADDSATLNLNDDKWWVNGEYVLYLRGGSSYGGFSFTPDVNNTPITVSSNYCVRMKAVNLYNNGSAAQEFSIAVGGSYLRKFYRTKFRTSDSTITYYPWKEAILQTSIGDGILFTDGKISVPEYQGATVSTPGTSGLVPPAAAGEQDLFLTGGGSYKAALTKITDSVASTASDTAASAKAVKSAYDRGSAGITAAGNAQAAANNALNVANTKVSRTGDTMEGRLGGLRGTAQSDPSIRYAHSALEIRENGAVGNTQSDVAYAPAIGFHWANKAAGTLVLRDDGAFAFLKQDGTKAAVDCNVPFATTAWAANRLRLGANVDTIWQWAGQGGQPQWVWGGNEPGTEMYVWNPANFNVNYANSAGYANSAKALSGITILFPNAWNVTAPSGGRYVWIGVNEGYLINVGGPVAGGTTFEYGSYCIRIMFIPVV